MIFSEKELSLILDALKPYYEHLKLQSPKSMQDLGYDVFGFVKSDYSILIDKINAIIHMLRDNNDYDSVNRDFVSKVLIGNHN